MSIQTFKRYEDKFIIDNEQFESLKEKLQGKMELDKFCRNGSYPIYNIYFDRSDNEVIRRSTEKPYYKEKLRLRSYGAPENDDSPVFLELKKKIGGIVNKRRATLSYREAKRFLESGEKPKHTDYITNQVLFEIENFLSRYKNEIKPAAFLSYNRIAMFGINNADFRITFDTDIKARRENVTLFGGNEGTLILPPDSYLMEVKFIGAMPMEFAAMLSELKIYSRSFSKIGAEYKIMLKEMQNADFDADAAVTASAC